MKKKILRIMILILVIVLIIIIIWSNNINNHENNEITDKENEITVKTQEEKKDEELKRIQNMDERSRMQYYIGKYFSYIQDKNYAEAYSLLYEEYVQEYFPIYTDYINYIQEKYPFDLIAIEYNNIERIGDLYVLWVNVVDVVNGNPMAEDKLEQKIVIREKGFNDFELSFSK